MLILLNFLNLNPGKIICINCNTLYSMCLCAFEFPFGYHPIIASWVNCNLASCQHTHDNISFDGIMFYLIRATGAPSMFHEPVSSVYQPQCVFTYATATTLNGNNVFRTLLSIVDGGRNWHCMCLRLHKTNYLKQKWFDTRNSRNSSILSWTRCQKMIRLLCNEGMRIMVMHTVQIFIL